MLKKAYAWYEEQKEGLGETLLKEANICFDKLEKQPGIYAIVKGNFREINLRTFPYVLVFSIEETEVIIYTVFHTSRNPKKKFIKS